MIDAINFPIIDGLLETGWIGSYEQLAKHLNLPIILIETIVSQNSVGDDGCWKVRNGIISHRTPKKTKGISMFEAGNLTQVKPIITALKQHSLLSYNELAQIIGCNIVDLRLTIETAKNEQIPGLKKQFFGKDSKYVWLSEHEEQVLVFAWKHENIAKYPQLGLMFAIPSGEERPKNNKGYSAVGVRLKATGTIDGIPDIFVDVPSHDGKYNGLRIELKKGIPTRKKGYLSPVQKKRLSLYYTYSKMDVSVQYGHTATINKIKDYLGI